jgi:hypothetical protein
MDSLLTDDLSKSLKSSSSLIAAAGAAAVYLAQPK